MCILKVNKFSQVTPRKFAAVIFLLEMYQGSLPQVSLIVLVNVCQPNAGKWIIVLICFSITISEISIFLMDHSDFLFH